MGTIEIAQQNLLRDPLTCTLGFIQYTLEPSRRASYQSVSRVCTGSDFRQSEEKPIRLREQQYQFRDKSKSYESYLPNLGLIGESEQFVMSLRDQYKNVYVVSVLSSFLGLARELLTSLQHRATIPCLLNFDSCSSFHHAHYIFARSFMLQSMRHAREDRACNFIRYIFKPIQTNLITDTYWLL